MKKTVLIVHAQPEPTSLTRHLVNIGVETLERQGHKVLLSNLYGMNWKATFDEHRPASTRAGLGSLPSPNMPMATGCRPRMSKSNRKKSWPLTP